MEKETFVSLLNAIKANQKERDAFSNMLEPYVENGFVSIGTKFESSVIRALELEMGDKPDPEFGTEISWWIYETNFGKRRAWVRVTKTKELIVLDTPEKLYDYLLENKNGRD